MPALAPAHVFVPENLHEIAGPGLLKLDKVVADAKLVEQACRARPVRVPAAPNALAIVLIANNQLVQRREIELQIPAITQRFDGFDKHDVSRAGAETGIWRGRNDKEFS